MKNYHHNNSGFVFAILETTFIYLWLFLKFLFQVILYSPLVATGYAITYFIAPLFDFHKLIFGLMLLFFTALVYCLVFFLKGMLIALKVNNHNYWWVLFAPLVFYTCGLPLFLGYTFFSGLFKDIPSFQIWGGIFGLIIGVLSYRKFDFLTDMSPQWVFAIYSKGFYIGLNWVDNPTDVTPDESKELW
jgi:hypothetical protein